MTNDNRVRAFLKTTILLAGVTLFLGILYNFHPAPWLEGGLVASFVLTIIFAIGAYVLDRSEP